MRLRRLCLEIFALRRFFKEPIAGVSVRRASEAQPKHRLSEMANAFAAKSRRSFFQKGHQNWNQQRQPKIWSLLGSAQMNDLNRSGVFWLAALPL